MPEHTGGGEEDMNDNVMVLALDLLVLELDLGLDSEVRLSLLHPD